MQVDNHSDGFEQNVTIDDPHSNFTPFEECTNNDQNNQNSDIGSNTPIADMVYNFYNSFHQSSSILFEEVVDPTPEIDQMHPILYQKLTSRSIDIACLDAGKIETSGKGVKQVIAVRTGIDKETAKKAVAKIKESKLKVQAQIQGDQLRVTGKKRDDLQATMRLLEKSELGLPFQFQNFRD